jgi:hypothetical protein
MNSISFAEQRRQTALIRQKAMDDFGLTPEQAVEYAMERQYGGLSHEDALAVVKKHNTQQGDK